MRQIERPALYSTFRKSWLGKVCMTAPYEWSWGIHLNLKCKHSRHLSFFGAWGIYLIIKYLVGNLVSIGCHNLYCILNRRGGGISPIISWNIWLATWYRSAAIICTAITLQGDTSPWFLYSVDIKTKVPPAGGPLLLLPTAHTGPLNFQFDVNGI